MAKTLWIFLFFICRAFASEPSGSNCQSSSDDSIKALSFNVQINTSRFQVGPWNERVHGITNLIHKEHVHVVGLQEVLSPMLDDLSGLLPDYAFISVGRDDGLRAGEHATLFYLKSRLKLIKTSTFWLSRTPDVPGSIGWDAWSPRVVTWALFQDLKTQKTFYVFNTHFDHWGEVAQIESARLLGTVSALESNGVPHIVLGDFNSKPNGPVYQTFLTYSGLSDAKTLGPHVGPEWTYSFFGLMKAKIDYIFVSSNVRVCQHEILSESPQAPVRLSDHLPVSVSFELKD